MKILIFLTVNIQVMSSSHSSVNGTITTKNLWCRDARAKYIINSLGYSPFRQARGSNIRECSYGDSCRGAHRLEEIRLLPHINRWNRVDKKNYDFPGMFCNIKDVLLKDAVKIREIDPNYRKLNNIENINVIQLIQLWKELACYYRKIAKEIPRKRDWKSTIPPKTHDSGYVFSDEVPGFYLDEKYDDNVWALERTTHYCNNHNDFKKKIDNKEQIIIWDLCLGESNCKEGIHHLDEMLCIDNFLTGSCDCKSKEEFDTYKTGLKDEIEIIEDKLNTVLKPKQIESFKASLFRKKAEFNNLQRKLHFTDSGMIPYDQQKIAYDKKILEDKAIAEAILAKTIKPAWDYNISKTGEVNVGKVIKLSLKK